MIKSLIKLYKDNKQLTLLEIAYFALSILSFAVAGIVALFNQSLGVNILIVPLIAFVAGLMNIVIWAVIRLVIEALIERDKSAPKNK
ncbi:hypothetical protein IKF40_00145 [Candidatus Saccharibacteria bacterium]|nr:hypothetical protein [Candidatus Saccharibacteria bacterium]